MPPMRSSDAQRGHDALFVQGREVKRVTKRGPVPKVGTGRPEKGARLLGVFLDDHLERGFHLGMHLDDDFVFAFALDRFFEFNRPAVHFHSLGGQRIVNVLVGDGAERLPP